MTREDLAPPCACTVCEAARSGRRLDSAAAAVVMARGSAPMHFVAGILAELVAAEPELQRNGALPALTKAVRMGWAGRHEVERSRGQQAPRLPQSLSGEPEP